MYYVKRILIGLLLLTTLNFYIPGVAISGEIILSSRDNITTHLPESVGTPEKDISGEATTVASEKGGKKWIWAVVSIVAIVGIAAGAGSGVKIIRVSDYFYELTRSILFRYSVYDYLEK